MKATCKLNTSGHGLLSFSGPIYCLPTLTMALAGLPTADCGVAHFCRPVGDPVVGGFLELESELGGFRGGYMG